jgi:DNA-binding GntR family transcriptional regulator
VAKRKSEQVKAVSVAGRKRYEQVAESLLESIRSGKLAVGATMPGELELVSQFGVSRHTVREALRRLQDFGLITRRRGIGTVVTADANAGAYVQRLGSPAELLRYPEPSRLEVRAASKITADAALASRLGCARGARWNVVSAVRRLQPSGTSIGWSDIYLSPRYAAVVPQVGRAGGRVFEMIERRYGARVARVEVEIRAGLVDASRAALLGVEAGSPSLTVLRRYREADGSVLQITIAEHPAERFTYAFDLHRSASGVGFEPG